MKFYRKLLDIFSLYDIGECNKIIGQRRLHFRYMEYISICWSLFFLGGTIMTSTKDLLYYIPAGQYGKKVFLHY